MLGLVQTTHAIQFMHFFPEVTLNSYFTCNSNKFGYLVSMSIIDQKQQVGGSSGSTE